MTVGELIKELSKFPADAEAWAYEGEVTGRCVIVANLTGKHELGYVPCRVNRRAEAVIYTTKAKGKR